MYKKLSSKFISYHFHPFFGLHLTNILKHHGEEKRINRRCCEKSEIIILIGSTFSGWDKNYMQMMCKNCKENYHSGLDMSYESICLDLSTIEDAIKVWDMRCENDKSLLEIIK